MKSAGCDTHGGGRGLGRVRWAFSQGRGTRVGCPDALSLERAGCHIHCGGFGIGGVRPLGVVPAGKP